jgi:general secretion pathway protein G
MHGRVNSIARFKGFTLIELMVTLVILGVLAAMTAPLMELAVQRHKEQDLQTALREIRQAIDAYKQATDDGRVIKSADASGYPSTLTSLVDGVEDAKDPKKRKIYFLRRIPNDPFTESAAKDDAIDWGLRSYSSPADRPEEGADVFDIYSKSEAIGLNGVPYRDW